MSFNVLPTALFWLSMELELVVRALDANYASFRDFSGEILAGALEHSLARRLAHFKRPEALRCPRRVACALMDQLVSVRFLVLIKRAGSAIEHVCPLSPAKICIAVRKRPVNSKEVRAIVVVDAERISVMDSRTHFSAAVHREIAAPGDDATDTCDAWVVPMSHRGRVIS